jgi:hypothetical protein
MMSKLARRPSGLGVAVAAVAAAGGAAGAAGTGHDTAAGTDFTSTGIEPSGDSTGTAAEHLCSDFIGSEQMIYVPWRTSA